jgi:hypothetical protein
MSSPQMTSTTLGLCHDLLDKQWEVIMDLGGLTAAVARNDYGWVHADAWASAEIGLTVSRESQWLKLTAVSQAMVLSLHRSLAAMTFRVIREA